MTVLTFAHAQDFLKNDMPFSTARRLILKNGWKPLSLSPSDPSTGRGTQEAVLRKKGIREVDTCSVDAGGLCNFIYQRNEHCLRVSTRGERLIYMRVIDWEVLQQCPGKGS